MSKFDNYGFPALEVAGSITPTDQELLEGFMLRSLHVLGIPHHCEFIRVEVKNGLQQAWKSDTSDPDNQERSEEARVEWLAVLDGEGQRLGNRR